VISEHRSYSGEAIDEHTEYSVLLYGYAFHAFSWISSAEAGTMAASHAGICLLKQAMITISMMPTQPLSRTHKHTNNEREREREIEWALRNNIRVQVNDLVSVLAFTSLIIEWLID
jgi:hypothetical protein